MSPKLNSEPPQGSNTMQINMNEQRHHLHFMSSVLSHLHECFNLKGINNNNNNKEK